MTECPICTETLGKNPLQNICFSSYCILLPSPAPLLSQRTVTYSAITWRVEGNEQWIQRVTLLKIEAHVSLGNSGHWCFKDFYEVTMTTSSAGDRRSCGCSKSQQCFKRRSFSVFLCNHVLSWVHRLRVPGWKHVTQDKDWRCRWLQ